MKNENLVLLFTVIFGFTFSYMLTTALKVIHKGVGYIFEAGVSNFSLRTGIIVLTFIICGIYFYHSLQIVRTLKLTGRIFFDYYQIIIVIFLSMGSWFCYHIARIIFSPFTQQILNWRAPFFNRDILFVIIFSISAFILFVGYKIFEKILF